MIKIRKASDRGHAEHGWLESFHTFSFAEYQDPEHMGFRCLRVINEDRVKPGQGFGEHGHKDMEILSYLLSGVLSHRDSMGNGSEIRPGDLQVMSAGSGVRHSEFNGSNDEGVHFLQMWVIPDALGIAPSYQQKHFSDEEKNNRLCLLVSPDGKDGSLKIHQDVKLYSTLLDAGKTVSLSLDSGRHAWVQMVRGEVSINGEKLRSGDGAAIASIPSLLFDAGSVSEFLVFDLP